MSEFLFIRPGFGSDCGYSWFVYDAEGENVLASGRHESLSELAEQNRETGDRPVVILFPSAKALFKQVAFPGRLRKNPNLCLCMLEDELAQDPDELEVRILHKNGNLYDVMITEKGMISNFEDEFKNHGFKIDRIVPDILALPFEGKSAKVGANLGEFMQKVMQILNKKVGSKNSKIEATQDALAQGVTKSAIDNEASPKVEDSASESLDNNVGAEDAKLNNNSESSTQEEQLNSSDASLAQTSTDAAIAKDEALEANSSVDNSFIALQLGDEWLVRTGLFQGYVVGASWLNTLAPNDETKVIALTPLPEPHPVNWQEQLCSSVAETMARTALSQEFSLTKIYAQKMLEMQFLYPWYKVAISLVLLVVLLLVNYNFAIKNLNAETQAYKQQQRIIYGKLTGSGPAVSNPVYSMKQLLSEQSPTGTYNGFVDLSKKLSAMLVEHAEMELVSLQYEQGRKQFVLRFLSDADWDEKKMATELKADFSVVLADSKPSRNQVLYTVNLRRVK